MAQMPSVIMAQMPNSLQKRVVQPFAWTGNAPWGANPPVTPPVTAALVVAV